MAPNFTLIRGTCRPCLCEEKLKIRPLSKLNTGGDPAGNPVSNNYKNLNLAA